MSVLIIKRRLDWVYLKDKSEYLATCSCHLASLLRELGQADYRRQPVFIYLDTRCAHSCITKAHI